MSKFKKADYLVILEYDNLLRTMIKHINPNHGDDYTEYLMRKYSILVKSSNKIKNNKAKYRLKVELQRRRLRKNQITG